MPVLLPGSTIKSPPHRPVFTPKSGASAARRCRRRWPGPAPAAAACVRAGPAAARTPEIRRSACAQNTAPVCFPPVHQEAREELPRSATLVAVADMHRVPRTRRRCPAAGLPRLDRRLLIRADDNVPLPSQSFGAFVQVQNGNGPLQEARVGGLLPTSILPGLDLVSLEPPFHGRGGDA